MPLTCTPNDLASASACYSEKYTDKGRDAIEVFLLAQLLAAKFGTDYTSDFPSTLLTDSACFGTFNSEKQGTAAYLYTLGNWGGNAIPLEIDDHIKCLSNANPEQLRAAKLFLWCQLSNTA